MSVVNLTLGDMMVVGCPPAKLLKACAVIADGLHRGFELRPSFVPGISRESCVLCSLTVRDFLRRIGFTDARVAPVCTLMWAVEKDVQLHSLGIGSPDDNRPDTADRWRGHMVVIVADYLIDTTLYRCKRAQWPELPGMIALPIAPDAATTYCGLKLLTGVSLSDPERDYCFQIAWYDNPSNRSWRAGPDCERERRWPGVVELVARFGTWQDAAA